MIDVQKAIELYTGVEPILEVVQKFKEKHDKLLAGTELPRFQYYDYLYVVNAFLNLQSENAMLKSEVESFKKISSRLIDNAVMSEQGDVFGYRDRAEELFKENAMLKAENEKLSQALSDSYSHSSLLHEKLSKAIRALSRLDGGMNVALEENRAKIYEGVARNTLSELSYISKEVQP
jgi:regulator of replication initiation timing